MPAYIKTSDQSQYCQTAKLKSPPNVLRIRCIRSHNASYNVIISSSEITEYSLHHVGDLSTFSNTAAHQESPSRHENDNNRYLFEKAITFE